MAREAAGTPLIVVRGKDGKARAFKNACRHRGTQLTSGTGCAGAFVCPYHGWSYSLDGELLGIPHNDGFPDVEKSKLGLAEVTVIEKHGLIYIVVQDDARADAGKMLAGLPDFHAARPARCSGKTRQSSKQTGNCIWKVFLRAII